MRIPSLFKKPKKDVVEFYIGEDGQWRWRYISQNGNNLANGSQGYSDLRDCENGAYRVTGFKSNRTVEFIHRYAKKLIPGTTLDEAKK